MSVQDTPPDPGYIPGFKQSSASLFGGVRRHILSFLHIRGLESSPQITLWKQLVEYSPAAYYYSAVSTAGRFLPQRGVINNLFQISSRLDQYWPTQILTYKYCSQVYINFYDGLPSFFALTPVTQHPNSVQLYPTVTQLPDIPIIVVTDVDGSRAGLYNALHETQEILSRDDGLLWREWTGKFSKARKTEDLFFDGAPPMPEDEDATYAETESLEADADSQGLNSSQNLEWVWEDEVNIVQDDIIAKDDGLAKNDIIVNAMEDNVLNAKDDNIANFKVDQEEAPRKLEWWEREDDSGDEAEQDEEYSDEEDSDDEYEDDSDEELSEEDSDLEEALGETPTNTLCSTTSQQTPVTKITVSLSCETRAQHTVPTQARTLTLRSCQVPQDLEDESSLVAPPPTSSPPSCFFIGDSDLESSNSSTTISSVPTPATPASPFVTPIGYSDPREGLSGGCSEFSEKSWFLVNSLDAALGATRRAELELELEIATGVSTISRGRAGARVLWGIDRLDHAAENP